MKSQPEQPQCLPVMEEFDMIEKEQTLWDWFSDGLGSRVLCGGKTANNQVTRKTPTPNITQGAREEL